MKNFFVGTEAKCFAVALELLSRFDFYYAETYFRLRGALQKLISTHKDHHTR